MKRNIVTAALYAAACWGTAASADEILVRFEGGIGVHPVAGINNATTPPSPILNVVRGVNPGGRPWAIQRLDAHIMTDGAISVRGEGLVLGGNDTIGTRGGTSQVVAQLFCGTASFLSAPADLSVGGDFRIRGQLTPMPPNPCASPALLIRSFANGAAGNWFAAGTLVDDKD
jgi:hypothetical protein